MSENAPMASSGRASRDLPPAPAEPAAGGLRERKKRKTRKAIQREAMRLFQEQGYEATTIEQIAAAAEVSPSTFFNYFPTKEDVVLADDYDPLLVSAFLARPRDEPLSVAVRGTLGQMLPTMVERDRQLILARGKLGLEVPDVRARLWDELERAQDLLRAVVAERTGRDPDDFELRVSVRILIWALYEASTEWVRQDGRGDLMQLVTRALDVVEAGAANALPPRGGE